ncbi:uncharacterized protein LOC129586619 isoform X2 [Paramacrobiotus metropolitanus]|uniref:uncharacterized protein LOC129586619 isoform X2 n=1 Tax=Paramacrobiotus metropolitanus TaxID=2943436 RepID=UPI002445E6C3|nr:uncharacterized protein LOC129586619 isoform X2 [Paramacrobiotus metropolitanus]
MTLLVFNQQHLRRCKPMAVCKRNLPSIVLRALVLTIASEWWERAWSAPVAPLDPALMASSAAMNRIVIFPRKVDNVLTCDKNLLREIEQYCVVHFDIDMSMYRNKEYESLVNRFQQRNAFNDRQKRSSNGTAASPFARSIAQPQARQKQRILVKCCQVGCTHLEMSKICH